ncbi:hypothetical protein bAD24_p00680 (plasmid) [Burkholderia sp. AD24]|nr:hypothetical protein bAD24_p00680 [Burkholderia sp. AD24]
MPAVVARLGTRCTAGGRGVLASAPRLYSFDVRCPVAAATTTGDRAAEPAGANCPAAGAYCTTLATLKLRVASGELVATEQTHQRARVALALICVIVIENDVRARNKRGDPSDLIGKSGEFLVVVVVIETVAC